MIYKIKYNLFEFFLLLNIFESIKNIGLLDYSHELGSELKVQVGSISSVKGIIPFSYEKLQICENKYLEKVDIH